MFGKSETQCMKYTEFFDNSQAHISDYICIIKQSTKSPP